MSSPPRSTLDGAADDEAARASSTRRFKLILTLYTSLCTPAEHDRVGEYEMKLMDIDQEHLGIPDTVYDAEIQLPAAEFARIIRDLKELGESVKIEVSKDGVRFSSEGDIGSAAVTLKQTSGAGKDASDEEGSDEEQEGSDEEQEEEEEEEEDAEEPKPEADEDVSFGCLRLPSYAEPSLISLHCAPPNHDRSSSRTRSPKSRPPPRRDPARPLPSPRPPTPTPTPRRRTRRRTKTRSPQSKSTRRTRWPPRSR